MRERQRKELSNIKEEPAPGLYDRVFCSGARSNDGEPDVQYTVVFHGRARGSPMRFFSIHFCVDWSGTT